ncbi:hypothetical protein Pfo_017224 [Paulownia fortunei]|nr:hypothetical protein Pfo_017224 [Paulownia fortunei]
MDEFGVLVESIGFRAHGKSAPMAKLKPKPKSHFTAHSTVNTWLHDDSYSLPVDELDGIFRSNVNISKTRQSQNIFVDDDIFGGPVSSSNQYGGIDLESVFLSSNNRKNNSSNLDSRNSVGSNAYDDLLGSKSKQRDPVDDLFGSFGPNSSGKREKKGPGLDVLIPGFEGASPSKNRVYSETNLSQESNGRPSNSSSPVIDDPFLIFESSVSQSDASWPFAGPSDRNTGKGSVRSSFDDFDDFTMGGSRSGSKVDGMKTTANKPSSGTSSNGFENASYLDAIFGGGNAVHRNNAARPSSVVQNSLFDDFFHEEKEPEVKQTSSRSSFSTKKASSAKNKGNDFTSLFGEFHEIEGEPVERRRARLNRHIRMNARMAEALAEKNQRDFQSQREQEEKRRLAETLDNDIKRWAAGKEGNLRALLSSLQQVLWPECGWRPVSLTDMITSESVKKVYKKATLYVHPDKVQQKGANLQQKYVAEKVFDLLKEAWNKFSADELR